MADSSENMVLRTIYLPKELDQTLKTAAIRGERSKGDVIRELIAAGLQALSQQSGSYLATPSATAKKPVQPTGIKRKTVLAGKPSARRRTRQSAAKA